MSVREKADDAPGFDGHPHYTPHPKQLTCPGLVGTRTLEGGVVTQACQFSGGNSGQTVYCRVKMIFAWKITE